MSTFFLQVILLEEPKEITQVIQQFAQACTALGRTEILNIIIPVEDKSLMEIRRLRHAAPSECTDAVDVILIEKDDRVPMLLDMNVSQIRQRMKRERLGKQIFLPRNYEYQSTPQEEEDTTVRQRTNGGGSGEGSKNNGVESAIELVLTDNQNGFAI